MPSTLARGTVLGLLSRMSLKGIGEMGGLAAAKSFRSIHQIA